MNDKDKAFTLTETAEKIGGMSRNVVLNEINDGKLKACWRGKRLYCTQENIDAYKKAQEFDAFRDAGEVDFDKYPSIKKVKV